jgi:hypothetical protein
MPKREIKILTYKIEAYRILARWQFQRWVKFCTRVALDLHNSLVYTIRIIILSAFFETAAAALLRGLLPESDSQ